MIVSFVAQRRAVTLLTATLCCACAATPATGTNVASKPALHASTVKVAPSSTAAAQLPREPLTSTLTARELFAELEAKRTGGAQPNSAPSEDPAQDPDALPDDPEWPELCRGLVNYSEDEQMDSCALTLHGNGSALALHIVSGCGGDSCEVLAWIYTQGLGRFVRVPGDVGGTLAADPSGRFLLLDEPTELSTPHEGDTASLRDPFGGKDELITVKLELPTMAKAPFAACFSPTLSPGGRWFVCRNRVGDVLKVPLEGGTPTLVVKSGVPKDDLRWVLYAYGYPEAVEFIGAARLRYRLEIQSRDDVEEREAPWSE